MPDLRPYLESSAVFVAPLRFASGMQNKILEAMSSGLPVVATPRAAQALTPAVAELVATGDTPAAFAAECVALLRDPARASSLGAEGRRRVTLDYSWDAAARRLLELMDDPSGSAGSRSPGTPTDSAEVARSACALP